MASSDNDHRRDSGERGSGDRRDESQERSGNRDDNDELASKSLRIQSKRYYVDVKENSRGRFIKLVEGLPNGTKNRLSFPMSVVPEVRDKLSKFAEFYSKLDTEAEREVPEDGKLHSDDIRSAQRKIYFDLKENKRGIFLRVSCTASYGSSRHTIALPAQGIEEVRDVLSEFIEEYGQDEEPHETPEFQEMRVERKRFYFDSGSNDRGAFLRISEVTSKYRSSITIPKQGLSKFKEILSDVISKIDG
ncbi:transcriptional activator protein Pur-alpha isoform X1 [Hydra vulgaris]|uniref:Transcriptional activator protein Pur-alpha isoform X2 n=1 Tax=Hydra vulgaris TaxID=6087 RepID=A0ABM4BYC0_HYDVU|nr:transcriptional activator protein Pur-alpha [Hydra vulgaris]